MSQAPEPGLFEPKTPAASWLNAELADPGLARVELRRTAQRAFRPMFLLETAMCCCFVPFLFVLLPRWRFNLLEFEELPLEPFRRWTQVDIQLSGASAPRVARFDVKDDEAELSALRGVCRQRAIALMELGPDGSLLASYFGQAPPPELAAELAFHECQRRLERAGFSCDGDELRAVIGRELPAPLWRDLLALALVLGLAPLLVLMASGRRAMKLAWKAITTRPAELHELEVDPFGVGYRATRMGQTLQESRFPLGALTKVEGGEQGLVLEGAGKRSQVEMLAGLPEVVPTVLQLMALVLGEGLERRRQELRALPARCVACAAPYAPGLSPRCPSCQSPTLKGAEPW